MKYKGDTGKFRQALADSGFAHRAEDSIFNDNSKDNTWRRLKLWRANDIFDASQSRQRKLEANLRKQFGKRILAMYFVGGAHHWTGDAALCIRLTA